MAETWRRWGLPVYMVGSTGCLVHSGSLNNGGYGPHRRLWEKEFGPVLKDMDLDHLCRNRWCVNLDHLEVVTRAENLRRGKNNNSSRPEPELCRKGLHPWIDENIYVEPRGKQVCNVCRLAYARNYYRTQVRSST